jgi:signal peptidase
MEKARKMINFAGRVATWALVAFTVFMMIFTVVTVITVDKNDRGLFGLRFYIVQTDSMSKSENNAHMDVHFNAGDIIVIKKAENARTLQVGDIIAFMSTNSISYGETVTHMIREVKTDAQGRIQGYVTYGTNTGTNDEALVEPEYVLGQYAGRLAGVGKFFAFVKSPIGYVVCILVPFLLLILYNGINVVRLFRKYKREQTAAMQAERDQLAREREENQRIMAELLALKAQLTPSGMQNNRTAPASEAPVDYGGINETDGTY